MAQDKQDQDLWNSIDKTMRPRAQDVVEPLEGDWERAMNAVEQSVTVSHITSFELVHCNKDHTVAQVLTSRFYKEFDFIPVEDKGVIVGVLERDREYAPNLTVGRGMRPLHEDILISAGAPVLEFVEAMEVSDYCLVLFGRKVEGIVTSSDLQKLAIRPVLFAQITRLELLLARWLRMHCSSAQVWLSTLTAGRRKKTEGMWRRLKRNGMSRDPVNATELADKAHAAVELGAFSHISRSRAKARLEEAEWLRDSVVHAGDYAATRRNARRAAKAVRTTRQLIRELTEATAIAPHPGPTFNEPDF